MVAMGSHEIELSASQGKVVRSSVETVLAAGASTVIETSETPQNLTRGYADIEEFQDQPIGAFARLIRRENGKIVESSSVPLLPGHESRSVLPLDYSEAATEMEIILISPTNSATLDLKLRRDNSELAFEKVLQFESGSQIFVNPWSDGSNWPAFAGAWNGR